MNGRRTHGKMQRYRGREVVLSKRDALVLRCLQKARVMRTSDFVPLVFPSIPIARRRLRKLMDAGYLACYVEDLHADNRWALDRGGYRELLGDDIDKRAPSRLPRSGSHHFTTVRFWVLLARASFVRADLSLIRFSFEWELPTAGIDTLTRHRPDAVFAVGTPAGPVQCFLEVDRGSETASYVGRSKVETFARLRAGRVPVHAVVADRLIVTAPSARRLGSIARKAPSAGDWAWGLVIAPEATDLSAGWFQLNRLRKDEGEGVPWGPLGDGLTDWSRCETTPEGRYP